MSVPPFPLAAAAPGRPVGVRLIALPEEAAGRLRDLGIREGAVIRVVRSEGRLIVRIGESRVGVPAELAAAIFVEEEPAA